MTAVTLLISVGGATGPIVYSIRRNQPQKVIFFVSLDSRSLVTSTILPQLMEDPGTIPDLEFVVTPNEQDLGQSTFVLMSEVPSAMRRLNVADLKWPQMVDYTGGTKTMSAALIWASSQHPCKMSYIGAGDVEGRAKDGLGTVIDGREVHFIQDNPWDRIAWLEARSALEIFNRGQYANAAALMRKMVERVSEELPCRIFTVLAEVFEGFHRWDIFDHRNALRLIEPNLSHLPELAETHQILIPGLKEFSLSVQEQFETLKGIKPGEKSWALIHDLLANALRRAELEQKYEDATARCYAAIEKTAQHELSLKYGIDPSNARAEQIPDKIRNEFVRRYETSYRMRDGSQGRKLQFGLIPAMELLFSLDDPIGQRFMQRREKLRPHLAERNYSILAHGIRAIDYPKFRELFEDALYLLNLTESNLIRFPTFDFG